PAGRRQGPGREVHGTAAGRLPRAARRSSPCPGDFYYRILRGWPGTGMENFGERLSVDDIWRVVLFVKTIPNHTLDRNVTPEPKDYITWAPSKELLAWLATTQKPQNN